MTLPPYRYARNVAVLSGAASGIGRALAHGLAERGSHLALIDRDEVGLRATADTITAAHPHLRVTTHPFDLAQTAEILGLHEAILREHRRVNLLINNAGVALGGSFWQLTLDGFEWLVNINYRAVVAMTHAFLPTLMSTLDSHVTNVSSLYGLMGVPGQTAYASSKFAVRGFTESLRQELAPYSVGVSCVHPGGVRTNIAREARLGSGVTEAEAQAGQDLMNRLLKLPPEQAAAVILHGTERRTPRILIGNDAKVADLIVRLTPGGYPAVIRRLRRAPKPNP